MCSHGNHGGIVGAERERRDVQGQVDLGKASLGQLAQPGVGADAAADADLLVSAG